MFLSLPPVTRQGFLIQISVSSIQGMNFDGIYRIHKRRPVLIPAMTLKAVRPPFLYLRWLSYSTGDSTEKWTLTRPSIHPTAYPTCKAAVFTTLFLRKTPNASKIKTEVAVISSKWLLQFPQVIDFDLKQICNDSNGATCCFHNAVTCLQDSQMNTPLPLKAGEFGIVELLMMLRGSPKE